MLQSSDLLRMFWLIPASALLLVAAPPAWRTKPTAQWTEEDAKLVLRNSPWAKSVTAGIARRQSEDERRESGDMGQPHGVGYDGVDPKGSGPKLPTSIPNILTAERSARSLARATSVTLRWESALPVRLAELKSHEVEPPTLEGDGYRIAVYGIPGADIKGDPKRLGEPLKNLAALKREGKKDVRPVSVEVFLQENGVVVVYLFPLSAEITKKDRQIQFEAHIGRIVVVQNFELSDMEFMGKLEL